jgi:DNA topoisomerase-3
MPSLSKRSRDVYELIARRFISIFYPPAVYDRVSLTLRVRTEAFSASLKTCVERGYLDALDYSFFRKKDDRAENGEKAENTQAEGADEKNRPTGDPGQAETRGADSVIPDYLKTARKGTKLQAGPFTIREGETAPPKRYTSGSMILAMENAGQLIEEEELREQIRGSGIGTSATRAEILKKLFNNDYLRLNTKTQVITPSQTGEMIFDTCSCALKPLLDPRLTASWELGLTQVADGKVSSDEYTRKLNSFITRRTNYIKDTDFHRILIQQYAQDAALYPEKTQAKKRRTASKKAASGSAGGGTRKRSSRKSGTKSGAKSTNSN